MVQSDAVRELGHTSKSQTITGVALFAALALFLNIAHIQIPAPYATFLIYDLWEIPIVICLFIFGLYAALTASAINAVVLILVNPGALASGPLYNLIAVVVSLLAIVLAHNLASQTKLSIRREMTLSTGLAMVVRTGVMTVVNYALLPFPPPLGFSIPESAVLPLLPLIAFFNATLILYTVPLGYAGVRAATQRLHFKIAYPLAPPVMKK